MRLIDADALLEQMRTEKEIYNGEARRGFNNCLLKVYDAPTIDAVPRPQALELPDYHYEEIVRCKDCKHYESDGGALMQCEVSNMIVTDTDFCSYGKRKTD